MSLMKAGPVRDGAPPVMGGALSSGRKRGAGLLSCLCEETLLRRAESAQPTENLSLRCPKALGPRDRNSLTPAAGGRGVLAGGEDVSPCQGPVWATD